MSIRIQNDSIASASTSQTGTVENAAKAGSSSARSGAAAHTGADQVDLSSFSGSIASASSALADQQAARVSQLTAVYSKGNYSVDSMKLSSALISNALGGSAGAES